VWGGGVVLLTKYLYLFIYTHNGDGTFQNSGLHSDKNVKGFTLLSLV